MIKSAHLLVSLLGCMACDDGKIVLTDPEPEPDPVNNAEEPDTTEEEVPSELEPFDTGGIDTGANDVPVLDTGNADTAAPPLFDVDADGFTIEEGDCDDSDPSVYPGAVERCDDIDHDCNGIAYNDLLVGYSIELTTPSNHQLFPSSHAGKETHHHEELWYNYRDYTTDQSALGVDATAYTGSIRPLVIRVLEVDDIETNTRTMFTHNDDGTLSGETRDNDDDGVDDYIAVFTHSDDGKLLASEYDDDGDGSNDRTEAFIYNDDGRLIMTMLLSLPLGTPEETVSYSHDDADNSVTITHSDAVPPSPDTIRWIRYREDGQPLEEALDEDADGTFDQTWVYNHDSDGRLTEILQEGAQRSRTTFSHDDAGNLTLKTIDNDMDDAVIDHYERHDRSEDGMLVASEYGRQELSGDTATDQPQYRYEYTRDDKGAWTERRIVSVSGDLVQPGVETATYNVDGALAQWTWTPDGLESPSGTMSTECLGPASPTIVESF